MSPRAATTASAPVEYGDFDFGPDTPELNKLIGTRVKQLRKSLKRTQIEMSQDVWGDPAMQSYLSKIERGQKRPNVATLEKIAHWGGVDLSYFSVEPKVGPAASNVVEARRILNDVQLQMRNLAEVERQVKRAAELLSA